MLSWSQDEPIEVQDFIAESVLEANDPDHFDTVTFTISNEGLQGHGGGAPQTEEPAVHLYFSPDGDGAIVIEDYPTVDENNLFSRPDTAAEHYQEIVEDLASRLAEDDRDVSVNHDPSNYHEIDFEFPGSLEQ